MHLFGHRVSRWQILLGTGLLVLAAFAVMLLQMLAILPVETYSEVKGAFKIHYKTYDAFGHRLTRKAIYRHGRWRDTLIARDAVDFTISEKEPRQLFYYAGGGTSPCGTYYADAGNGPAVRVAGCYMDFARLEEGGAWSPDHRYATLDGENAAVIVELGRGASFDVGQRLQIDPPKRTAKFGPWMPDGISHLIGTVVIVTTLTNPGPPLVDVEQDLFIAYPRTKRIEYVASRAPRPFDPAEYQWRRLGTMWILPVSLNSVMAASPGVWRKTHKDLPPAVSSIE